MVFNDITVIIKTFLRPDCLKKCISSIRQFYPNIKIMVADDSNEENLSIRNDIDEYLVLPFDTGLSFGRNQLLKCVKTPYFVLLDDDTIFTQETKLEYALWVLKNTQYDIVGGVYLPDEFYGSLDKKNEYLERSFGKYNEVLDGFPVYDFVPNFFVGKTERVREVAWCNELKVQEHTEFFWRAKGKLKSTLLPYFTSINSHERNLDLYNKFRFRKNIYFPKMFEIIGVKGFKDDKTNLKTDLSKDKRLNKYAYTKPDFDTILSMYQAKNSGYPLIITTCQKNLKKVEVQKATWLKNLKDVEIYFIIGNPSMKEEYKIENNILYMKCSDEYLGLPEKMLAAYRYFSLHRPDVKGVLKFDDDNYINCKNFYRFFFNCHCKDYLGNSLCFFSKADYDSSKENRDRGLFVLTNYFREKGIKNHGYLPEITGRWYNGGHGYYLSKKSINTLTEHYSKNPIKEIYEDKMVADTLRKYDLIEWDLSLPPKNKKIFDFRRRYTNDEDFAKINLNSFFLFCDVPEEKMFELYRRERPNFKNVENENVIFFKSNILFNDGLEMNIPDENVIVNKNDFKIDENNPHRFYLIGLVQNPWERLYQLWCFIQKGFNNEFDNIKNISFEKFILDYLPKNKDKNRLFDSQSKYLPIKGNKLVLNNLIKIEEIKNQSVYIKLVFKRMGDLEIHYDYKKHYNPKMLMTINSLYEDDVKILGYDFKPSSVNYIDFIPDEILKMSEIDRPKGVMNKESKYKKKENKKNDLFKNIKTSNSKFLF